MPTLVVGIVPTLDTVSTVGIVPAAGLGIVLAVQALYIGEKMNLRRSHS